MHYLFNYLILKQKGTECKKDKGDSLDSRRGGLKGTHLKVDILLITSAMDNDLICPLLESNVLEEAIHAILVFLVIRIELEFGVADIVVVLVDKHGVLVLGLISKVVSGAILEIKHGGVGSVVKGHGAVLIELKEVLAILLQTDPEDDGDDAAAGAFAVESESNGLGLELRGIELEGVSADLLTRKSIGLLFLVVDVKGGADGAALVDIVVVDAVLDLVKIGELGELGAVLGLRDGIEGVELDDVATVHGDVDHHTGRVSDHAVTKSSAGDTGKDSNNKLVHLCNACACFLFYFLKEGFLILNILIFLIIFRVLYVAFVFVFFLYISILFIYSVIFFLLLLSLGFYMNFGYFT